MRRISFVLGSLFLLSSCQNQSNKLTIINHSTEVIKKIEVTVSGQTITIDNLQPSESSVKSFNIQGDSGFHVQSVSTTGKMLTAEDGYVTNGMTFEYKITIDDSVISVEDMTVR